MTSMTQNAEPVQQAPTYALCSSPTHREPLITEQQCEHQCLACDAPWHQCPICEPVAPKLCPDCDADEDTRSRYAEELDRP